MYTFNVFPLVLSFFSIVVSATNRDQCPARDSNAKKQHQLKTIVVNMKWGKKHNCWNCRTLLLLCCFRFFLYTPSMVGCHQIFCWNTCSVQAAHTGGSSVCMSAVAQRRRNVFTIHQNVQMYNMHVNNNTVRKKIYLLFMKDTELYECDTVHRTLTCDTFNFYKYSRRNSI